MFLFGVLLHFEIIEKVIIRFNCNK